VSVGAHRSPFVVPKVTLRFISPGRTFLNLRNTFFFSTVCPFATGFIVRARDCFATATATRGGASLPTPSGPRSALTWPVDRHPPPPSRGRVFPPFISSNSYGTVQRQRCQNQNQPGSAAVSFRASRPSGAGWKKYAGITRPTDQRTKTRSDSNWIGKAGSRGLQSKESQGALKRP